MFLKETQRRYFRVSCCAEIPFDLHTGRCGFDLTTSRHDSAEERARWGFDCGNEELTGAEVLLTLTAFGILVM